MTFPDVILAIILQGAVILVAVGVAWGTLRAEIKEIQRRQDVTNGRLGEQERQQGSQGERISHLEGEGHYY